MPTLTLPYTFVNGTTADANQVDADLNAVATVVNGLDNANVGAAGFYASQIIPTATFQAQFGGALGYTFAPGVAGQVPLTLTGTASQAADLFDVFAGTNKLAYCDNAGTWHAPIYQLGATGPLLNAVGNDMYIASGLGSTTGTIHFRPNGYSNGDVATIAPNGAWRFLNLPTNGLVLTPAADGNLAVLAMTNAANSKTMFRVDSTDANNAIAYCARGGNLANMLLVQNNTGAQIANTLHAVTGSVSAVGTSTAVTLSGSAAFSGSAYYLVVVDNSSGGAVATITAQAAGSFTFTSVNAHSYSYFAVGV